VGRKIFLLALFILAIFFVGIDYYLVIYRQSSSESQKTSQISPNPMPEAAIPVVKASQNTSVDSPDGKVTLAMKITKSDSGVTYSFSTSTKTVFEKTVDSSISFSIPVNTWSPDNKYVFLKEVGPAYVNFFVLSAAKDSSQQDDQTASISGLFAKKYPNLTIKDVTGWGGINLVIVNSNNTDGSRGSSFWFDARSHSFIQLATRF
jgi:hypothetical protein